MPATENRASSFGRFLLALFVGGLGCILVLVMVIVNPWSKPSEELPELPVTPAAAVAFERFVTVVEYHEYIIYVDPTSNVNPQDQISDGIKHLRVNYDIISTDTVVRAGASYNAGASRPGGSSTSQLFMAESYCRVLVRLKQNAPYY